MRALVLGAQGQDGTLLMQNLRQRGYIVLGTARLPSQDPDLVQADLRDVAQVGRVLEEVEPDAIFHFAAIHGQAGTSYETIWPDMLAVNVGSTHAVLEYMRRKKPAARLLYASSGKLFGSAPPARIDSGTRPNPDCLYGISKQAACSVIAYYRRTHGVHASALHLFNHESWLRAPVYFIPKLVGILKDAVRDRARSTTLASLNFYCDWGSAAEYMDIAIELMARDLLDSDYLVARGQCMFARDLAERLFRRFGLDHRDHISEKAPHGPPMPAPYHVVCDQLESRLGRLPGIAIDDICLEILRRNHDIAPPGA